MENISIKEIQAIMSKYTQRQKPVALNYHTIKSEIHLLGRIAIQLMENSDLERIQMVNTVE